MMAKWLVDVKDKARVEKSVVYSGLEQVVVKVAWKVETSDTT